MDVFPSYWDKVKEMALAKQICSIDKVKAELFRNNDDLTSWCNENLNPAFFSDWASATHRYAQVTNWAFSRLRNPYSQSALDIFMDIEEADAFLAAYALANGLTLVTYEVSAPSSKKSIKLPDVCEAFQISVISPVELLRRLGITI